MCLHFRTQAAPLLAPLASGRDATGANLATGQPAESLSPRQFLRLFML